MPKLIVLDQNKLREHRAPELVELLNSEPETLFVVPDLALIEMTKTENREKMLRGSFALLAQHPHRVRVAKGIQDCLKIELYSYQSSVPQLIDTGHTEKLARLMAALQGSDDEVGQSDLKRIVEDPTGVHKVLARVYYDSAANRAQLGGVIDDLKNRLPSSALKDLRGGRLARDDLIYYIHGIGNLFLERLLTRLGWPLDQVKTFRKSKPILLREHYSMVWLGLDWIAKKGFESASDKRIANDLVDHDYVLTATCCSGLLSGDTRVNVAYGDLLDVLDYGPYKDD